MKDIKTRVTRLETMAHAGREIPQGDRIQVILGRKINGKFVHDNPLDTEDTRRKALIIRYGNDQGITYVRVIDSFGERKR